MMETVRIAPNLLADRLDARYNSKAAVGLRQLLKDCRLNTEPMSEIFTKVACGPFGSTLTEDELSSSGEVLVVQPTNINGDFFSTESAWRVSREVLKAKGLPLYSPGTFVFARVGVYPHVGIIPKGVGDSTISSKIIAATCRPNSDPHYLFAFFRGKHGRPLLFAAQKSTAQPTIGTYEILQTWVPVPDPAAQRYIGSKVRQAERLQDRADRLQSAIDALSCPETIRAVLTMQDFKFNRFAASALDARLDGKYYGRRAMAVLKACHEAGGVRISDLNPKVSNGFEYRDFSETGRPYITVTEVSSGRLDITGAPRIPWEATVPLKATVNERCAFVVRTGSVGTAVKAHSEDAHACISSHLIRLEFEKEAQSSAVTAWLNSPAGKCLQGKISYGGVQPQISQDDLLALPIPHAVLKAADRILVLWEEREQCLRAASRLVAAAKTLVEALIERCVEGGELSSVQEAIARGQYMADRELLGRLTTSGLDVGGAPKLFPDLNALYRIIKDAETALPPEAK
jgi:type I restriction enzyme S subunit